MSNAEDAVTLQLKVILWDRDSQRRDQLLGRFKEGGFQVCVALDVEDAVELCSYKGCRVAVIGLDGDACDDPAMLCIRALAERGCLVIACGRQPERWPIRVRCVTLLSGAFRIQDCFARDFINTIKDLAADRGAELARQSIRDDQVRERMRRLGVVGVSPTMLALFHRMTRVSELSDVPVLISGETGTGKERFAQAIYRLDPKRCKGPFVPVNCGSINPTLAESEFFGHRCGAFSGAVRNRKGLFASANGGVLFLDEIGELNPVLQIKLLRVLQEGRVMRVGDDRESSIDVRVLAATNRDLPALILAERFREDLYFRLNVLSIHIPPLRERVADIAALVGHFLTRYRNYGPDEETVASGEFIEAMTRIRLPGNARQIENIVREALVKQERPGPLTLQDLPMDVLRETAGLDISAPPRRPVHDPAPATTITSRTRLGLPAVSDPELRDDELNLARQMAHHERWIVETAIRRTRGNQTRAASLLGITPRSVYTKIRKYGLIT